MQPPNNKISKRKLESYKRAEKVCQELRYQLEHAQRNDMNAVMEYVIHWMATTGNLKYDRPVPLKNTNLASAQTKNNSSVT